MGTPEGQNFFVARRSWPAPQLVDWKIPTYHLSLTAPQLFKLEQAVRTIFLRPTPRTAQSTASSIALNFQALVLSLLRNPDHTARTAMEVRVSARRLEAYPLGRGGELCGGRPRDVEGWGQVFDLWLVGSGGRIVDLWEDFGDSVVRRVTRPSEIVQRAVERNTHLFLQFTEFGSRKARDPFSKVLAVHIRRGDYEGHCVRLAKGNASFYGWSQLPWPPDRFKIDVGENGHEEGEYMKHCLPDVERIIGKIHATRDEWEKETVAQISELDTSILFTSLQMPTQNGSRISSPGYMIKAVDGKS